MMYHNMNYVIPYHIISYNMMCAYITYVCVYIYIYRERERSINIYIYYDIGRDI